MAIDGSIVYLEQIALYRILRVLPQEDTSVKDLSLRGLLQGVGVAQSCITDLIRCLDQNGYLLVSGATSLMVYRGVSPVPDDEMFEVTGNLVESFHSQSGYEDRSFLSKAGMSSSLGYYKEPGVPFSAMDRDGRVRVKSAALAKRGGDAILSESSRMREAIESRPEPAIGMSVYYFDNDVLKVGVISKIEARLSTTLTVDSLVYTVTNRELHTESIAYNVFTTRDALEEWFRNRVESLGEL